MSLALVLREWVLDHARQVNIVKPSAAEVRRRAGLKRPSASGAAMKRPSAKRPAAAIEDVAAAAEPDEEVQPVIADVAPADPPIEEGDQPLRYGCSKCKRRQKGCTQCRTWASQGKHHRKIINDGDVVDRTPR